MRRYFLWFVLAGLFLLNPEIHAQSQSDMVKYFNLYERVRQASGVVHQGGMLLLQGETRILWRNGSDGILLLQTTDEPNVCTLDEVEPRLRQQMLAELGRLVSPTLLSSKRYFPNEYLVSRAVTDLLNEMGARPLQKNCRIDILEILTMSSCPQLLGLLSTLEPSETVGKLDLFLCGKYFTIKRASRPWLFDAGNRMKLVQAIDNHSVSEILGLGDEGMVATTRTGAVFLVTWSSPAQKIDLLPWSGAQPIMIANARDLFSDNTAATISTEDEYFELLAKTAFGRGAWGRSIRQAPHIVFRDWK